MLATPSLVGSEEERERRMQTVTSGKLALIALCREEVCVRASERAREERDAHARREAERGVVPPARLAGACAQARAGGTCSMDARSGPREGGG